MKKPFHSPRVGVSVVALAALATLAVGCSSSSPSSQASGGSTSSVPGAAGSNASGAGGAGAPSASGGASTSGGSNSGGASGAGVSGAGGSASGGAPAGVSGSTGSGGAVASMGGGAGSSAGSPGGGGAGSGTPSTVELIGPETATCGAKNATHGDGFVCVLNYPAAGANVVGYWFDYSFVAMTCGLGLKKPTGNQDANPQVCFSGSGCGADQGAGLGVALCDVHGIDVSTWPELMSLETMSSLSSTVKSPASGCNAGSKVASVSWTLASGTLPAGTSVLFDDADDKTVTRVDNLAAGATSAAVPAGVDVSKVASIKFSVTGASSPSWNFCFSSFKLSLH